MNTSQFLNALSNVAEKKIHDIDENLDKIETIVSIFEEKMDSLPEEYFDNIPVTESQDGVSALPMTETLAQPVRYLEAVDNALNAAGANPKMVVAPAAPRQQP